MTLKKALSTLATITVGLLLGIASSAESLDTIVAVINDDVVMESELDRRVARIKKEIEGRKGQAPPDSVLEKEVLERLILARIQVQQAERRGIRIDDEMLNRAISNIASQNGVTLENFRQTLETEGFSYDEFREDIREEITLSRVRQTEVENRIFVSEREINNYLATQSHQGLDEEEFRIQHILISRDEESDEDNAEEIKKLAEETLAKLQSGSDFITMVTEVSDAGNASNGGDLGWMTKAQLPSLFSIATTDMKKGEISNLIKNSSGYHIIKLMDKRSSDLQMISQTRARHILIRPNELVSEDEVRLRLTNLKDRLESGADFDELARSNSEDRGSAVEGGDLGWLSPGNTVPEFEEVMNQTKVNEISQPFKSQFGWHIVQVTGHREHDGTEELTRAKARAQIKKRKVAEEQQTWLGKLRDEAYVEYR